MIGVVAPSFPVLPQWRDDYERGKAALRSLGFEVREGRTIGPVRYWAAGSPREQADDLNAMFADPEIRAIWAHSGGFPAMSVLSHLDYDAIRADPKPFLGYSDNTLYHLAFLAHAGLVGFHADNLTHGVGDTWHGLPEARRRYLIDLYRRALTEPTPLGPIQLTRDGEAWRPGAARGRLIGGCLKRITALAATPFFPPLDAFDGAILFWEEIGREIWDVSIDLHILRHMGVFDRIRGMLIGELTWINQGFEGIEYPSVREVVLDATDGYGFPIMANLPFGHSIANVPMPIGLEAEFDAEAGRFAILEPSVR